MQSETLSACTDCLFFAEYGNHDEFAECFSRDEWDARQAELEEAHAKRGQLHAGERLDEFSTRACEVCGSRLGGERHALTELIP